MTQLSPLNNEISNSCSAFAFQHLQSVQNSAARLITGARRRDRITPVLRQLHWLPVRQRVDFKMAALVYKSLHGLTPPYLSEDCQLVTDLGRQQLRSADVHTCAVHWTQTPLGDRSFAVAGPRLWNNLPVELWQWDICLSEFRRLLKTFVFCWDSTPCDFLFKCAVYKYTYLLTAWSILQVTLCSSELDSHEELCIPLTF